MRSKLKFISGLGVAAMLALSTSAYAGEITIYTSLEEDDAKVYLERSVCRGFPTPPPIRPLPVRLPDRNGGFPRLSGYPWL